MTWQRKKWTGICYAWSIMKCNVLLLDDEFLIFSMIRCLMKFSCKLFLKYQANNLQSRLMHCCDCNCIIPKRGTIKLGGDSAIQTTARPTSPAPSSFQYWWSEVGLMLSDNGLVIDQMACFDLLDQYIAQAYLRSFLFSEIFIWMNSKDSSHIEMLHSYII